MGNVFDCAAYTQQHALVDDKAPPKVPEEITIEKDVCVSNNGGEQNFVPFSAAKNPRPQLVHARLPDCAANFPTGQSEQLIAEGSSRNFPGGQSKHLVIPISSANVPGEQEVHEVDPAFVEYDFKGHILHLIADWISVYRPGWQSLQNDWPGLFEKVPGEQGRQNLEPRLGALFPKGHILHVEESTVASRNFPNSQS